MIAAAVSSSTLLYTLTPHRSPPAQSPPSRFRRIICSASSNSNSIKISAATPGSSPCPPPSRADRDNDIALRLPELKTLLDTLRSARQAAGGDLGGPGSVSLVGTGPGDPELLTLKAVKAIGSADLILYDRLVSNEVLGLVRPEARMLYVGKTAGYHSRTQEEIHELLLSFAEVGANVVRLKGGDPLVFGRGGEEMDFLQQQGIQVKIIPGITSASGIAAELGIPLTHRGLANSVIFLTGHSRKGGTDPLYVGEHAADPDSTLVVYMGLATLPALATKLMNFGLSFDTPAVAVERGTTRQQQTVFAQLKYLADEVKLAELVSPTLIIIGKVVALSPLWTPVSVETLKTEVERPCTVQTNGLAAEEEKTNCKTKEMVELSNPNPQTKQQLKGRPLMQLQHEGMRRSYNKNISSQLWLYQTP